MKNFESGLKISACKAKKSKVLILNGKVKKPENGKIYTPLKTKKDSKVQPSESFSDGYFRYY